MPMISEGLSNTYSAVQDIVLGVKRFKVVNMFVMRDLKQRYQRTALGPFWITLSMAILIITLAFVLGRLFKTDINKLLPFLASGLILWSFMSNSISEACLAYVNNEEYIKSINLPYSFYLYRIVWSNFIILMHNLLVFIGLAIYFGIFTSTKVPYAVLGLALFLLNCLWVMLLLSLICIRHRDITNVVQNVLQIVFYFTPVIWMPITVGGEYSRFIWLNPLFHLLEIVRQPLLGQVPGFTSYSIAAGSLVFGWLLVIVAYGRYRNSVPYWL